MYKYNCQNGNKLERKYVTVKNCTLSVVRSQNRNKSEWKNVKKPKQVRTEKCQETNFN